MGMVAVGIRDETGSPLGAVDLPDDVPVNRIVVKLVEKLGLPMRDATGNRLLAYKLHHSGDGKFRQLRDEQTLAHAGVKDNDILGLYGEMIAGGPG